MEHKILTLSYWLGVCCVGVALVWRGLATLTPAIRLTFSFGSYTTSHMALVKGGALLLLLAIATAAYLRERA